MPAVQPAASPEIASWDIFCKVIDNHGDLGVCWRLASQLARRGHGVKLWVDQPDALEWMAPDGENGVELRHWTDSLAGDLPHAVPGDVVIEAFGCALDDAFVQAMAVRASTGSAPLWLNLEYLSAEAWVERNHGLMSPVMSGPGAGLSKFFFYPGFTKRSGGLLREPDLIENQRNFERALWLGGKGVEWQPGDRVVSLFCYEPAGLPELLRQLGRGPRTHLLVTAGRATAAVRSALKAFEQVEKSSSSPSSTTSASSQVARVALPEITFLAPLTQIDFDHLLWSADLNFVRGEDSLVRALWAGKPFVWHIYPQHDGAHHAKLDAFLDWMDAPDSLRKFSHAWNGIGSLPLNDIDVVGWSSTAQSARRSALEQADLAARLEAFRTQRHLK